MPHFEKMLYDNALLARALPLGWLDGRASRATARRQWTSLAYLAREMTTPEGGLYSSQDADSEGARGEVLRLDAGAGRGGGRDAPGAEALCTHLGVTVEGNFEGKPAENVLTRRRRATPTLAEGRRLLFEAREKRAHPSRDEKVLAGWNGLALSALARGGAVLGDPTLLAAARRAADFVRTKLTEPGRPAAVVAGRAGPHPRLSPRTTRSWRWRTSISTTPSFEPRTSPGRARSPTRCSTASTPRRRTALGVAARDAETLVHRPVGLYDNAIPGATSAGLEAWQRLAWLTGEARYREAAAAVVRRHVDAMVENLWVSEICCAASTATCAGRSRSWWSGRSTDPQTQALLKAARGVYLPNRALAHVEPGAPPAHLDKALWEGRERPRYRRSTFAENTPASHRSPIRRPLVVALREARAR